MYLALSYLGNTGEDEDVGRMVCLNTAGKREKKRQSVSRIEEREGDLNLFIQHFPQ